MVYIKRNLSNYEVPEYKPKGLLIKWSNREPRYLITGYQ